MWRPRHIGGRSPTHGDDRIFAPELEASTLVPQGCDDLNRLPGLGIGMIGRRRVDSPIVQVLRQGSSAPSERARMNDEYLGGGLVKGLIHWFEAKPVSDGDSGGVFSCDLDGCAHECSNSCAMAVTTSSTGPGPD